MCYFFHVDNGTGRFQDEEGRELASPAEARAHAMDGIRSILAEEVKEGRMDMSGRIEVTDAEGAEQFVVRYRDAVTITGGDR